MTVALPSTVHSTGGDKGLALKVAVLGGVWAIVISIVVVELIVNGRESMISQILGTVGILCALLFCLVLSIIAAIRTPAVRRAWIMIALAMLLSALSQTSYVIAAITRSDIPPSVASDALGLLGYGIPFFCALYFFPRPADLLISKFRQILDVVVITVGIVLISEATVLAVIRQAADLSTPGGLLIFAYPIVDVAICAAVLCLGMRQRSGDRLTWLVLGTGMVIVGLTDSVYVRFLVTGEDHLTATPLVAGWMAAPVLIGLATLIPFRSHATTSSVVSLPAQLVPYIPIFGALTVLALADTLQDGFLLIVGALLLVAVTIRQLMIVYENVSLTRDLEGKVASRTRELATLGSIVTSSSDAVVGVSMDSKITAWNPAADKLYGYRAADVVGQSPDFLSREALGYVRGLLQDAAQGGPARSFEADWPRPDGTTVPVAMTVSPIVDQYGVQGISVIGGDISERRRAEAYLEQAREEALESSRLKSEFLATMSHEIRTPMNGVIGLTTLLLETELDADQRQYADGVRGAGEALLAVINDILDFSKLEAGKVLLEHTDFDPRRLVDEVGALLAPAADVKGLELIAYCLPDVPETLRGDPGRIRQILLNLASNAVKFTSVGEVVVKVRTEQIDETGIRLLVDVTDTGIGISVKDQQRLFQSFSQADASTTRRFGGTGLGLAICRRLIEVMGGRIGVDSEPGKGSRFWFETPLTLGEITTRRPVEPSYDLLKDLRVLVVDDNETNRTILAAQLTSWGMQVDLAVDANMALEWLQSRADEGHPYDLAALDMCMPGIDGLALARMITADTTLNGTPLIMLTSASNPEPGELEGAGIGQCVTKPVRSSDLYDRLIRLMTPMEAELKVRRRAPEHRTAAPAGSRGSVLVVEDNDLNQMVADAVISRMGYDVHRAADGYEALIALERNSYRAVLMDCHMPGMDGFTATREIRRREPAGSRVPIIAMTAGALPEDRERCIAAGMEAYVSKPIDIDRLGVLLDELATDAVGPLPRAAADEVPLDDAVTIDPGRLAELSELASADGTGLLQSLVTSFVDRSRNRLDVIRAAGLSGDMRLVGDAAHELKGAAGTIGAVRVAQLCRELETAVRRDQPLRTDLLDQLAIELDRATSELQGMDLTTAATR